MTQQYQKAQYGNNTGNRAPAAKPAYQARPAARAPAAAGMKKDLPPLPPTTHFMKSAQTKEFVGNVYITENETGLFVKVKEGLAPGNYYINAKKSHQSGGNTGSNSGAATVEVDIEL